MTERKDKYMKNIVITGGAGFIGSHVVRLFVNKYPEYNIICLDKLTYAGNLANLKDIENKSGVIDTYQSLKSFEEDDQVSFGSYVKEELVEKLKNLEPDVLSPIEALSMLYELSKKAKEC